MKSELWGKKMVGIISGESGIFRGLAGETLVESILKSNLKIRKKMFPEAKGKVSVIHAGGSRNREDTIMICGEFKMFNISLNT